MDETEHLVETTLGDLIDDQKLPSGYSVTMKPDTVENALMVGEAQDDRPWREKLLQAMACVDKINGKPVDEQGGVSFLGNLADTDILTIMMAWTAEANGRKIELSEGVPCPECQHPFTEIPLGPIKMMVRKVPVEGSGAIFPFDFGLSEKGMSKIPEALRDAKFYIRAPTWKAARIHVSKRTMDKADMVRVYRAMAALMYQAKGASSPTPVPHAIAKMMPSMVIRRIIKEMDKVVPYMAREIKITCSKCGAELDVPFDQAVDST